MKWDHSLPTSQHFFTETCDCKSLGPAISLTKTNYQTKIAAADKSEGKNNGKLFKLIT
jgi:hypothetical protein